MKFLNIKNLLPLLMSVVLFSCTGTSGEEGDGGDLTGELVLNVSKSIIVADGTDAAVFTVMKGETDVTGQAKIYVDNKVFEGTSLTSSEIREYVVYASYNGELTEKKTIKAIESGYVEIPEDSKPDQFEEFKHRTLFVQATGTWCPNCPYVTSAIHKYQEDITDGNAVFAAAHNGDGMANDFSAKVISWLNVSSFPSLTHSLNGTTELYNTIDTEALVSSMSSVVESNLETECYTNIAASVSYSEDGLKLNVLANVKVAKAGKYRIQAWVLEDGIIEAQEMGPGISGDFDTHNNVLRYSSSTSATGETLGNSTDLKAGTVEEFACSFDIDKLGVNDLSKCRVVIVTLNGFSGKFTTDNVVECSIGGTVAYEYK